MSSGRDLFLRYASVLNILCLIFKILPKSVLIFFWDFFSRFSQFPFIGIRYVILKCLCGSVGKNVRVGTNVRILNWHKLNIGDNVSIHDNCYFDAYGGLIIGSNISIAHNSSILTSNHTWINSDTPIKYNAVELGRVTIFDDVWIGCGARILSGVTVKSRSVVAAGAVVTDEFESNVVIGGVPARVLKRI
ncbi:MAG: Acetyltransferase (isoleucine patch superfamily) [Marinobacter excellens HL-55]|uniref:Acetyltransferase (Isoleucine patch superfamily) n=1 Tax=Marinobacter excellens HL-55 TaxID=1305731 RepID=A0A0P7YHK4_9GAMM|nr:MAG: Acetyltransferase (isoleucine patch superfamily) [Marinobacter excellens HL-55]